MNRLTKKDIEGIYDFTYSNGGFVRGICPLGEHPNQEIYVNGLNKLGKLEDLEEQLCCYLENIIPLLLAYKQGYVYIKDVEEKTIKEEIISQVGLTTDGEWCLMTRKGFVLDKDHKKTWWLFETKEE